MYSLLCAASVQNNKRSTFASSYTAGAHLSVMYYLRVYWYLSVEMYLNK